jgi:hypothetical protein
MKVVLLMTDRLVLPAVFDEMRAQALNMGMTKLYTARQRRID